MSLSTFTKCASGIVLGLGTLLTFNTAVFAANIRPVNFNNASLQSQLNSMTVQGPLINTINDQSSASIFTNVASSGAVASFMLELAGYAGSNTFGIYKQGSPNIKAQIFSGADTQGAQKLISFLGNGDVKIDGNITSGLGNVFGFYITTPDQNTFYSEDILNPNGAAQALIYQGNNQTKLQIPGLQPGKFTSDEWVIAFEDLLLAQSDRDYDDLAVLVGEIEPAPEPAIILGLGITGVTMFLSRRRKNN